MVVTTVDNQTACSAEVPAAADPVAADVQGIVAEEGARIRRAKRIVWWAAAIYVAVAGLTVTCDMLVSKSPHSYLLMQAVLWPALVVQWRMRRIQREAGGKLERLNDPRAAGPLTHVLSCGDKDAEAAARSALQKLLPRLTACDGDVLSAIQRATLNRLLRRRAQPRYWHGSDDSLAFAILKAWEQVGDADAVESARYVAEHARSPKLARAAREALPAIEQRAAAEHARTTLLRPATGSGEADVLMRPAAAADDAPAHLLRATTGRCSGADGGA